MFMTGLTVGLSFGLGLLALYAVARGVMFVIDLVDDKLDPID